MFRRLLSNRKRESGEAAGKKLVYYSNKPCMVILSNSLARGKK